MKAYSKSVISILQSFIGRNIGGSSDVYIRDVEYSKVDETYINDLFLYQTIIDATVTI
jgi:hypothetical protein